MAGVLLGALSFAGAAAAGEPMDFTGPYAGFNLGYGFGGSRERDGVALPFDRGSGADLALPPSAAAAARAMRAGRSAAPGSSRTAVPSN